MSAANKHLQAAGVSIASNIFVQVLSRGFTFILGAITLKYLGSSALLGIINVRLALLYSTLQFLSREPFRRACLGEAAKNSEKLRSLNNPNWHRINNTIWLGFILSLVLSIPLAYIWNLNSPSNDDLYGTTTDDYHIAVFVICLAVIVEMLSEPCFIYAQAKAITDHNPKVEITAMTLKCLTVAIVTIIESGKYKSGQSNYILTKIAICQLFGSLVSVIYSYYRLCNEQKLSPMKFLPTIKTTTSKSNEDTRFIYRYLDRISLKLSFSFLSQTFLKQLLTEGERYIMTFFNVISLSEQGIYDVVNNLGSLAARLVFKPIEDSSYTLFSQTVSRSEILDIRKFYRVQENLMFLIKSMLLIGLMVLVFGYNFVPLIVLYGGDKLNNPLAFHLMKWQLFYTPLIAVNGVTECFSFAIMNTSEIKGYNLYMIFCSVTFLVSIYLTQPIFGSACFIFSNCLIMISRILFSYRLIKNYFTKHGYTFEIKETVPSLTTMISLSGVYIFLSTSQYYLLDMTHPYSVIFGVILGGWCLLFMIHVVMCHEEALLNFVARLFKLKTR